jgi:lipopolysaccharide biosynthesis regulator YciM
MARAKLKPDENDGAIKEKDYAQAVRIYRQDIKQAISKVGEFSQELSTAYKAIKKQCGISSKAAKLAFQLDDMEDFKRDDFLRSLGGMLKELGIQQPFDMVDMANESATRERPRLVTVGTGDETDLADAADEVDEFDAAAPEAVAAE